MTVCDAEIELPEPVQRAIEVLDTGVQRQDDFCAQVQDIVALAFAAHCTAIVLLIPRSWVAGSLGGPSGRDHRIVEAAEILEELEPLSPAEQGHMLRRLALAAGCYDADQRLKEALPNL